MTVSYALVAPIAMAEDAKRLVRSLGIGRTDLKIGRRDAHVLIPLSRPIDPPLPGTRVEVVEFSGLKPPKNYKDVVQVPDRIRSLLPTSFDVVGDLVLVKIPGDLRVFGPAIGEAILKVHKNIKAVFRDDGVAGPFRVRSLVPLVGESRTSTTHQEFGARFNVDLAKAYFSPRLANEHDRIARLAGPEEVVVDATAGVGPFAVLIARQHRVAKVHAFDLNPDAVDLLRANVKESRVESLVDIRQGDAKALIPTVAGPHRVIINLPHGGEDILSVAAKQVAAGGTLHYYRIIDEASSAEAPQRWAEGLSKSSGRRVRALESHVVHAYSPQDRLMAVDFSVDGG